MEALEQLKTLRSEALHRLQFNADYKLFTSLDNLIVDLESTSQPARPKFMIIDEDDGVEEGPALENSESIGEAFEKIAAELDEDEATTATADKDLQPIVSFS